MPLLPARPQRCDSWRCPPPQAAPARSLQRPKASRTTTATDERSPPRAVSRTTAHRSVSVQYANTARCPRGRSPCRAHARALQCPSGHRLSERDCRDFELRFFGNGVDMISDDAIDEQLRVVKGRKDDAPPRGPSKPRSALKRAIAASDFHAVAFRDLELPGILFVDFNHGLATRPRQLLDAPGHR